MALDQSTSGIHRALSEISEGHNRNVEEVVKPSMKRGKTSRRYLPKVMKARLPAASKLKTPDGETCHSMLKNFLPLEFREELFEEGIVDSIQWFVFTQAVVSSLK